MCIRDSLYRGHGVGIATGAASGVWVLDVDDWDALVALESEHGPLPPTYTVVTGSGGIHHYFAMPAGQTITNANRLPKGIDVRGDDSAAAANFETLAPGDLVRQAGSSSWHVVRRVNAKTVSVESGYSWAIRVPRDRIAETRKQQPTAELAAQVRGAL